MIDCVMSIMYYFSTLNTLTVPSLTKKLKLLGLLSELTQRELLLKLLNKDVTTSLKTGNNMQQQNIAIIFFYTCH